jgi:hypothetical protein
MCLGIALASSELPLELIERHRLQRRLHAGAGRNEYRFLIRDRSPQLPAWRDGQLVIVRWGNTRRQSTSLPATAWTWRETVEQGGWLNAGAVPIDIPANYVLDGGVWYHVREGIRGILAPDERGRAVAYVICEPASHYYQVMTRSDRMPVFIGERI